MKSKELEILKAARAKVVADPSMHICYQLNLTAIDLDDGKINLDSYRMMLGRLIGEVKELIDDSFSVERWLNLSTFGVKGSVNHIYRIAILDTLIARRN